jgi:tetratricopeptide (TPR) repeat protein
MKKAIDMLKALVAEYPRQPDYQYLLALCYRDGVAPSPSTETDEAIRLLETLCREHPNVADYQFELAETYAMFDPRLMPRGSQTSLENNLRKAVSLTSRLVMEHPNVPEYANLDLHAQHRLANLLRARARDLRGLDREKTLNEAESLQRQSIQRQKSLIEQFPHVTSYHFWLGKMRQTLAEILAERDDLTAAQATLESSIEVLRSQIASNSTDTLRRVLAETYELLAEVHEVQDHPDQAKQTRDASRAEPKAAAPSP